MPISGRNMRKLFEEIGYVLVAGGKGSHMKLKKKKCPTVTIPDHKELKPGTEHKPRKILNSVK